MDVAHRRSPAPAPATRRHRALDLAVLHALADGRPLVVQLLATAEPELGLRTALGPVEPQRHQRHAALLDLPAQALDLPAMQQQLPGPDRVVPELARRRVR